MVEIAQRCAAGEDAPPDGFALCCVREGEGHHEAQAALEGGVERCLVVGGENRQPPISLHALEQVAHLDIGVATVAVFDFAALA